MTTTDDESACLDNSQEAQVTDGMVSQGTGLIGRDA